MFAQHLLNLQTFFPQNFKPEKLFQVPQVRQTGFLALLPRRDSHHMILVRIVWTVL